MAPSCRFLSPSRLVIYSSNEVQTPYDDWDCQDNCYEPCGTIEHVDQLTRIGESLILRFFHIRLSDITKYTGSVAKKVRRGGDVGYVPKVVQDQWVSVWVSEWVSEWETLDGICFVVFCCGSDTKGFYPCPSGVGVTKPISSVPLFSEFFNLIKTHVIYWISRLYLTGVAGAQLRWHLSNINVIRII